MKREAEKRGMVSCPRCGEHVNYVYLRAESPKCHKGHDMGTWVHCLEKGHVYLRNEFTQSCPYCGERVFETMKEGLTVKCLHPYGEGRICTTRPFVWIKEGPPCFMNHTDMMKIETKVV